MVWSGDGKLMLTKRAATNKSAFDCRKKFLFPRKDLRERKSVYLVGADLKEYFRCWVGVKYATLTVQKQNGGGEMFKAGKGGKKLVRHCSLYKQDPSQKC
jgi:hypothetical protein